MIPRVRVAYITFVLSCFLYLFFLSPLIFFIFIEDGVSMATMIYPFVAAVAFAVLISLESVFYLYASGLLLRNFSIGIICACFFSLVITGFAFSLLLMFLTEYWMFGFFILIIIFFAELINWFFYRVEGRNN